jgi:NAD-dependent deacetylase
LAAGGPCRRAFLAVRPPGHHASADRAQGYCYLNTAALAARLLQDRGIATRVAILDVDAHHGNGTQALLPRLGEAVYALVHGAGYPGTGSADEPPRCWNRTLSGDGGGEAWLAALDAVATGLVSTRPDAVVISFGTDALRYDPVGDLGLTQDDLDLGVRRALERMAGIPVISVMEGGYTWATSPKRCAGTCIPWRPHEGRHRVRTGSHPRVRTPHMTRHHHMTDVPDPHAQIPMVILTGAGISAGSGLATFRGAGGLWNGTPVTEVASPAGWQKNPDRVRTFYDQRRCALAQVEPSVAHRALADLQRSVAVRIITQNVDDLHERAGSNDVLHLHGALTRVRSCLDPAITWDIGYQAQDPLARCPRGSRWRPDIVWFGEEVPLISIAQQVIARTQEVWIIGTSLSVYPAAGLWQCAPSTARMVYVDPHPTTRLPDRVQVVAASADQAVPGLVQEFLQRRCSDPPSDPAPR